MIEQADQNSNVYAAILAGGSGKRMGNPDKPKQFLMLGTKPIIVHTVEKFYAAHAFQRIVVLSPRVWIQQTQDLIRRYAPECLSFVDVVAGGNTRNDTVRNAIDYISSTYPVDDKTIIVTHDAVRPFVSHRILMDNIGAARAYGSCDTVVPASDTIVVSNDGKFINQIPIRQNEYQGQTPQSFNLLKLQQYMQTLTHEEESALTDACKIFVIRGEKVALVRGEVSNMKITYPQDLRVAQAMVGE